MQRGFTLIELVIVMTIIAILAAIALPRFASLQADARIAKMNAAVGALKAAAAMAHAQLLAKGLAADFTGDPAGVQDINMEGQNVTFANGYPDANEIASIAGIVATEYDLSPPSATSQTVAPDVSHGGAAGCIVTYTEAVAGGQPTYNVANLTVANCD